MDYTGLAAVITALAGLAAAVAGIVRAYRDGDPEGSMDGEINT